MENSYADQRDAYLSYHIKFYPAYERKYPKPKSNEDQRFKLMLARDIVIAKISEKTLQYLGPAVMMDPTFKGLLEANRFSELEMAAKHAIAPRT
jgi:hypothetical protein